MQCTLSRQVWLICLAICIHFTLLPAQEKSIVVLIPSYNNRQWVRQNLTSALSQKYNNFRIIYIDDASEDDTTEQVNLTLRRLNYTVPFQLIRNPQRLGSLANIYSALHHYCDDQEIVAILDGDDWFSDSYVLQTLNTEYTTKNIWMTHGAFVEHPQADCSWSIPIPEDIVTTNAFREFRCPSHLKTFYAWLFKKIRIEDLQYQGEFFAMTGDQAIMFPMIEMAGERHSFISRLTYVYNRSNLINDNKVNPTLQQNLEKLIRSMPRYLRLDSPPVKERTDNVLIPRNETSSTLNSKSAMRMVSSFTGK